MQFASEREHIFKLQLFLLNLLLCAEICIEDEHNIPYFLFLYCYVPSCLSILILSFGSNINEKQYSIKWKSITLHFSLYFLITLLLL